MQYKDPSPKQDTTNMWQTIHIGNYNVEHLKERQVTCYKKSARGIERSIMDTAVCLYQPRGS